MKDKHPIDELFRSGLEEHRIKPGANAWEKVSDGLESKESRTGVYLWRAAAVALLIGLSSVMYFNTNEDQLMDVVNNTPVENGIDTPEEHNTGKTGGAKSEPQEPAKADKAEQPKPMRQGMKPILKSGSINKQILVHNEIPVVDEENLVSETESEIIEAESLKVQESPKKQGIKLKYTVPVTQRSFYAENQEQDNTEEESKPKIKERLFAYASDQFGNLIRGEALELPKAEMEGKPHLEINLGRIIND